MRLLDRTNPVRWARMLSFVFCGMILLASCKKNASNVQSRMQMTVPVTAAVAVQKDVPVQIEAVGSVEAFRTVSVKAMVGGQITHIYFEEGQHVSKGMLLFTVDPRPFQDDLEKNQANLAKDLAYVKQAQANLAKDIAQQRNAQTEVKRYAGLIHQGYVSAEQFDQIRTNAQSLQATVRADQALVQTAQQTIGIDQSAIDSSKLTLEYCYVRAPIDGQAGSLLIHEGNLIKANDTPSLVVINQIQPIHVTFAVPQEQLDEIKKYKALGQLKVEAIPAAESEKSEIGKIDFIDNAVDPATGTVKLKGLFNNDDKTLWPGRFANVKLTLRDEPNAIVVPSSAVLTGQMGSYLFAIKPDMTVEIRPVIVERTMGDESVIKSGLRSGEKVVTDGQLLLGPGAKVEVKKGE